VSERLHEAGVRHRLQRSAQDRVVPAWIGRLFLQNSGSSLTRAAFDRLVPSLGLPPGVEVNTTWEWLRRATSRRGDDRSVDMGRLRTLIATGRVPDELTAQPAAAVLVSSFHRAKGLEFDRIVVVDPGPEREDSDVDPGEEARMLYVAMTRARDELWWINTLGGWWLRTDRKTERWARFGREKWRRQGLEMASRDVLIDVPAGAADFTADCAELQEHLAAGVHAGDEVVLERLYEEAIGLRESPPYVVMHDGRPIGTASHRFRADLYRHLTLWRGYVPEKWPGRITGVRIDAVETVAGSTAAGIEAGLGEHGVWLVPRLAGLSRFVWDKRNSEDEVRDV
jgi:hypothetical protein